MDIKEKVLSEYLIWWLDDITINDLRVFPDVEDIAGAILTPHVIEGIDMLSSYHEYSGHIFTGKTLQKEIIEPFSVPVFDNLAFPDRFKNFGGIVIKLEDYDLVKVFCDSTGIDIDITDTLLLVDYAGDGACIIDDSDDRVSITDITAAEYISKLEYYTAESDETDAFDEHDGPANYSQDVDDYENQQNAYSMNDYLKDYEGITINNI